MSSCPKHGCQLSPSDLNGVDIVDLSGTCPCPKCPGRVGESESPEFDGSEDETTFWYCDECGLKWGVTVTEAYRAILD